MITDGSKPQPEFQDAVAAAAAQAVVSEHDTLKYHLLGPSLTKAGQDSVDQQKVATVMPCKQCASCLLTLAVDLRDNI